MATNDRKTGEVLLSVEGVKVAYGGIQAVKGVTLEVRQGELVSLIGANGAGKTTTLKAITGLQPIADGDVRYLGKSLKGTSRNRPCSPQPGLHLHKSSAGEQLMPAASCCPPVAAPRDGVLPLTRAVQTHLRS